MRDAVTRSILAAVDLAAGSDAVLRAAAELARRTGADLHVLHALDIPPTPYFDIPGEMAAVEARLSGVEEALRTKVARVVPDDVTVASVRVEFFAAHRAIGLRAGEVGADLVVLGPHARRELEIGFLGGTADRVIRTVSAPCLVVRGPLRLPLRRVVAPIDLSEPARGALDVALAWTRAFGAADPELPMPGTELDIVHVVPKALVSPTLPFERASVLPGVNREVEAALERAGGAPSVDVREEVLWGERPQDEIVRYARGRDADLVILATHGYGAVKRYLVGGTATAVAREAPCPVLLVPPRLWRTEPQAVERGAVEREMEAAAV